jgi:hypothetical protein
MLMFIGFGICISAYYIYHNKDNVFMNLAKAGVKLEDVYLNYKGMSISYLVPDHTNYNLLDQYNKYYLDRYVSNLSHNDNYNKTNNEYFVILKYNIKRKTLCYVKNSFTFSEMNILEEDMNYSSPIILCSLSIFETNTDNDDKKALFTDIDVTECFNYLVNKNSKLILSNNRKYKEFWIYYFNYFLQSRSIFINCSNLDNIELVWSIMDDKIKTTNGSEIFVTTDNNSTNICLIGNESMHNLSHNENEYDSIEDYNQIDFSQKDNSDVNHYDTDNSLNTQYDDEVNHESNVILADDEHEDEPINDEPVNDESNVILADDEHEDEPVNDEPVNHESNVILADEDEPVNGESNVILADEDEPVNDEPVNDESNVILADDEHEDEPVNDEPVNGESNVILADDEHEPVNGESNVILADEDEPVNDESNVILDDNAIQSISNSLVENIIEHVLETNNEIIQMHELNDDNIQG